MNRYVWNFANLLSVSRLVLLPVLYYLAWSGQTFAFLAVLCVSLLTDSVDGFIARKLGVESDLGARLDTLGDLSTYYSLPLFIWWLWPDIFRRELLFIVPVFLSVVLPVVASIIKFHRMPSYHTWLAKLSAVLMSGSIVLLLTGVTPWPFRVFSIIPVVGAIEEILITCALPAWHADVRSLRHARRIAEKCVGV